jgi:outer membrane protein assembly factor BamB
MATIAFVATRPPASRSSHPLRPRRGTALLAGTIALALTGCAGRAAVGSGASAPVSGGSGSAHAASIPGANWTQFDYNSQRTGVGPAATGITGADLGQLKSRIVHLPGTVDSAPVELHAVRVGRRVRDVVILTTSYGITVALDPGTGARLWKFVPRGTGALEGTRQITTATPIVDPNHRFVYAASPNGVIHKLRISSGRQVWGRGITTNPAREKIEGALNIDGSSLVASTGGYDGDIPTYQGHVVLISRRTGNITHVWNSLCSGHHHLIDPTSSCPASDSAIWGRSGSVIEPGSGRILVSTGNGPFNGRTNWGDSVLELSHSLRLLHNWTPRDQSSLNNSDMDLGSTEPALLPPVAGLHLAVQGAKDGRLRLLSLRRLDGTTGRAGPRTGGELQTIKAPGPTDVFTEPVVWSHNGHTFVFVADGGGTAGYELGGNHRLFAVWQRAAAGTSPVVAGGLLYVYDPGGQLVVRNPLTGQALASLAAAPGHWNSPIVVGGRIILPVGNDNLHQTSGLLYIYHLPGR